MFGENCYPNHSYICKSIKIFKLRILSAVDLQKGVSYDFFQYVIHTLIIFKLFPETCLCFCMLIHRRRRLLLLRRRHHHRTC
jgi:hypothetical protein